MELVLDLKKRYTIADYLTWADDVRRELIDGFIKLFPAPSPLHADVTGNVYSSLKVNNKKDGLRVFIAPVDVFFFDDTLEKGHTVVQPDVLITTEDRVTEKGIIGPPLLIVEVLSKKNRKNDLVDKLFLYRKYAVKQYWICNPRTKTVEVFLHDGEDFKDSIEFGIGDKIQFIMNGVQFEILVDVIFI